MATDTPQKELFRFYWPDYLPLWLSPLPLTLAVLIYHFSTSSALGLTAVVLSLLYWFGSGFWASLRYMEGSVTWGQQLLLSAPWLAVAIVAMVLFMLICALMGRPL